MSFIDDWRTLSMRIRGLNEAAKLDSLLRPGAPAMTGSTRLLQAQAREIFEELRKFHSQYRSSLPAATLQLLETADSLSPKPTAQPGTTPEINRGSAVNDLVHLQALESAITYSLSGSEEAIYSLTERAFQHLQRSLIVDDALRARWKAAFDKGETTLEALGAVHLLGHGIFAFKVDARGARTDLVMPDNDPMEASRYATGIVLTEWKKADSEQEASAKFEEAHKQAALYAEGPLASIELRRTRYAVVVTMARVATPKDREADGARYRYLNIAVEHAVPSKTVRR